ncbi:MaoC family dehydratase, partial [Nitrospinaceae bacterium]|nr:MaoC family dehydratase [Nitrospinaceae bacterium]
MIQHSFSLEDQIDFAKLSGDYNPVHVDSVIARRTRFGHPVVHGLHALLWALEILVASKSDFLKLVSLRAYFNHSIGLGEIVQLIIKSEGETCAEIQLLSRNKQVARIVVSYVPWENEEYLNFSDSNPGSRDCLDRNPEQLANAAGKLDLCLSRNETTQRFPSLMRVFPSSQLAELMAITRLIGMECPGLNSIFSDLNLNFSNPCDGVPYLNYKVLSCDQRIGLLTQNVEAPGMTGILRAFIRPSPQNQ